MEQGGTRNHFGGEAHTVVQAGVINGLVVGAPPSPAEHGDPWVRRALDSTVWRHVTCAGREAGPFRERVAAVVGELAAVRDALPAREDDPWQDPGIPLRFLDHLEWLLREPGEPPGLDLYPAEAALFVLLPFLHRVHYARRAARLAPAVRPWALRAEEGAAAERAAFQVSAGEDESLVRRALRDPAVERQVGWWLFHRWLAQQGELADPGSVAELLAELGPAVGELGELLGTARVTRLLHALRRGPDVCHPEFLEHLPADDRVRCGPGTQRVRDQRLALLAALAYTVSVEMTALPGIVVEHLGVPQPVDLHALRDTLEHAGWGGAPDTPVLRADCHHEAVVEALREYVSRADELLHAVRRTVRDRVTQPMPVLPTRLSADGATPAEGAFDGYARFRSDGRRFRDLAMGIELYKDPDLAVRELYQNALDACRYRRAREEYLARTAPSPFAATESASYAGNIEFAQGTDDGGRPYVDCVDNGVGMGESELRGVFSQAGARFVEQLEFKLERAEWERLDPPVRLYPNSRFGIGVLSYFMLADEIRVTTCRMAPDGSFGPVYEISICGPSHLFRIVRVADRGRDSGTRVRLFLREGEGFDPAEWSCVGVLERLLGIAEFPTVARDGERAARWEAGVLRSREPSVRRWLDSYYTAGAHLAWDGAPEGTQVIWCERGGALLVDGLAVDPSVRKGVFHQRGAGLTGAVVNLSGSWSPVKLSVDRRNVLDDLTDRVRKLLEGGAPTLAASANPDLPTYRWLCGRFNDSPLLADIITSALLARRRELLLGKVVFATQQTGVFPADTSLLPEGYVTRRSKKLTSFRRLGDVPDHVYLWRLLVHPAEGALDDLAAICPDVADPGPVRTALPSDQQVLTTSDTGCHWLQGRIGPGLISVLAARLQSTPHEISVRLASLGYPEADPDCWPEGVHLTKADSAAFRTPFDKPLAADAPVSPEQLAYSARRIRRDIAGTAKLMRGFGFQIADETVALCKTLQQNGVLSGDTFWEPLRHLCTDGVAPPGLLVWGALRLGTTIPEFAARFTACGVAAEVGVLPDFPPEVTVYLLSAAVNGCAPWLDQRQPVPAGHVLRAANVLNLPIAKVLATLEALGFTSPSPFPRDASRADLVFHYDWASKDYIDPSEPLPYRALFRNLSGPDELRHRLARLGDYGFNVPLRVPDHPDDTDAELLRDGGPFPWNTLKAGETAPFVHAVRAARDVEDDPRALARRLRSYGLHTSHEGLPKGLTFAEALKVARTDELSAEEQTDPARFPLQYLHHAARERHTSLTRIASWLRQLGIPVPDPADTIRAALARVPRPDPAGPAAANPAPAPTNPLPHSGR